MHRNIVFGKVESSVIEIS